MREVDIQTFARAHSDRGAVIDIREPWEYEQGHVPGARLVPMGELVARLGELPADEPVYLICATGNRSLYMIPDLVNAGIDAYSVRGGTSGWQHSGRPVVSGRNADAIL